MTPLVIPQALCWANARCSMSSRTQAGRRRRCVCLCVCVCALMCILFAYFYFIFFKPPIGDYDFRWLRTRHELNAEKFSVTEAVSFSNIFGIIQINNHFFVILVETKFSTKWFWSWGRAWGTHLMSPIFLYVCTPEICLCVSNNTYAWALTWV